MKVFTPPYFIFLILFFLFTAKLEAQIQISFTTSDYNGYHVSCFGAKDGSITVNVTGGTPPYTYLWSNDQTTATITGLSADYYGVMVTDSDSVHVEGGINLSAPEILKPVLNPYEYNNGYNISLFGASNGSITTSVNGGVSPFSYHWVDGPVTQNRSMLGGGLYSLEVTDANACLATIQTVLSEPERDDWTMNGNAGSDSTKYIGTTDNKDFVLKTNAVERMRIRSDGIIDVLGNFRFDSLAGDTMPKSLFIGTDGTLYRSGQGGAIRSMCNTIADWYVGQDVVRDVVLCDPGQQVGINGCTAPLEAFQIGDVWTFHSGSGVQDNKFIGFNAYWNGSANKKLLAGYSSRIVFNNQTDANGGSIDLQVDGAAGNAGDDITWINGIHLNKSGKVGIGTYTPSHALEIKHNDFHGGIVLDRDHGTSAHSQIYFKKQGVEKWAIGNDSQENGSQDFWIWNNVNPNGGNGGSAPFFINQYNKIGINTTPPNNNTSVYSLFVAGGIATRDVKVQATGWPDYALSHDFDLMTIDELDDFISENQHLPGFPSAKEIEENEGYEAGDMIQRQQKQIEQQALYIIGLQKQLNVLKSELEGLQADLKK